MSGFPHLYSPWGAECKPVKRRSLPSLMPWSHALQWCILVWWRYPAVPCNEDMTAAQVHRCLAVDPVHSAKNLW